MVKCEMCKPCTKYNRAMEVCDAYHTIEMLGHPDYCAYKEEKKG